jgi:hypothetical protein
MGKGKATLEILASSLKEDYKFPILEVFVFLYTFSTFIFASPSIVGTLESYGSTVTEDSMVFGIVKSLMGPPLFVLVILVLKNVAYGMGNDLERGVIRTYLSYPLRRISLLTANILSSVGLAFLLFIGVQVFALFILVPDLILANMGTVLLTYAAYLCYPLLIASLMLLLTLKVKKGGNALVFGIILYFGSQILAAGAVELAISMNTSTPMIISSIINPSVALQEYYHPGSVYPPLYWHEVWTVSFTDALLFTGAGYALVILVLAAAYVYFKRRLET